MDLSDAIEVLHKEKCSCVILKDGRAIICHDRGVKDLYKILLNKPQLLVDASIADKVVGKGAAALMIIGKVKEIYADVISEPALDLLKSTDISLAYSVLVPYIINRAGTGVCPVESLCKEALTADECLTFIAGFLNRINDN